MNDQAFLQLKPLFKGEDALIAWLGAVLDKAATDYVRKSKSEENRNVARNRVLQTIQILKADPEANVDLNGILGKPREDFSWEELREEAVGDKYGKL